MQIKTAQITIIIPTTCTAQRADLLRRAIASIQTAGPDIASVMVAANGPHISLQLIAELSQRPELQVVRFEEGSSPKALARAVQLLNTDYFGFLDDDDELLPNGLLQRLALLQAQPEADIVLSNGYLQKSQRDQDYLQHLDNVPANPLAAFFVENWLPSCGALFRRASVGPAYFQNYHPYAEWSWLAFRLALDKKRFCILNEPTFRVYADTPASLSKSSEYRQSYISLYQKMLAVATPSNVRCIIQKRLSQAHHDVSSYALGFF
jgi:glycosyltransferase involved in cell wall biosynthesis